MDGSPRAESRYRAESGQQFFRNESQPRRRMAPPPGTTSRKGVFIRQGRPAPPLVVHPDAVSRGSAWGPLFLGLLLLGGVGWYAIKHYTPQIEHDLTLRSTDALSQAGLAGNASVSVSGRNAILTGSVATSADREQAENAVASTFGVRAVDNQLTVGATDLSATDTLIQPTLEIISEGDTVNLSGTVSDPAFATSLEQTAKDQFGDTNVSGSITVDQNSTNPGWLAAVSQLLPETDGIENVGLSIANGTLTLTGESSAESKESIGKKATELLKGHLTVKNLIEAPEPAAPLLPAFASVRVNGDQTTLKGFMSSEGAVSFVESIDSSTATVVNNITINDLAETPQWIGRIGHSMTALQDVENANLTVTRSGAINLSGTVSSEEIKTATEHSISAAFGADHRITNNLVVELPPVVPTMTPFVSVSEVDDQVQISGLLPPASANSIVDAYRAQGKTVVNNIAADERVMTPAWADQLPMSLTALDSISDGKVNISSAGELILTGTAPSDADRQAAEDSSITLFADTVKVRNDIVVVALTSVVPTPVVPTMSAFATVSEDGDDVHISGLLPPETAKNIIETYQSQGKTVIDNIAADERVIVPAWADQISQSLTTLGDVDGRRVNVSSAGELTISGIAATESDRLAAETNAATLFGDSVSLRNDIIVETPTIAPAPDLRELFDRIDLAAIRFKSNSADLDTESIAILEQVSAALAQAPDAIVTIGGHTDSTGNYDYNLSLSAERAETVRRFLVDRGTNPDRLTAIGFGPSQPIANNGTVTGRALNRRIEFKLSGE